MPLNLVKDEYLNDCLQQEKDRMGMDPEKYNSNGAFMVLLEANLPGHRDMKVLVNAVDLESREVLEFGLGLIEDSNDQEMVELTIMNNLVYLVMARANDYVDVVLEEYVELISDYGFESEFLEQIRSTPTEDLGDWIE